MVRQGVLGGRGQFSNVLRNGRRCSGAQLRAAYLVVQREHGPVRCGISVFRQTGSAVRRNRIRRLIREAIRLRSDEILRAASQARRGVDIVFQIRPGIPGPLHQVSLQSIIPDVEKIFSIITGRIIQGKP